MRESRPIIIQLGDGRQDIVIGIVRFACYILGIAGIELLNERFIFFIEFLAPHPIQPLQL